MATVLDTHRAVKALREADFSEAQAEAVAELWRSSREADIAQLATKADLEHLELRLTIKLGGMIAAAVAIVGGLVALF